MILISFLNSNINKAEVEDEVCILIGRIGEDADENMETKIRKKEIHNDFNFFGMFSIL